MKAATWVPQPPEKRNMSMVPSKKELMVAQNSQIDEPLEKQEMMRICQTEIAEGLEGALDNPPTAVSIADFEILEPLSFGGYGKVVLC